MAIIVGWFSIPNWMESHSKFHGSSHHQPVHEYDPNIHGLVGGDWNHGILNDFPFSWEWKIIPTDFH